MKALFIGASLFLATTSAFPASVFRCVDQSGHVTFSQQGCPEEQSQNRHFAANPTPGSGKAVPMAPPRTRREANLKEIDSLAIVAEREDGCGNRVTGSDRRSAIISKQIRAGMTRSDVESALGRPENITSSNGRDRLRFRDGAGQVRTVSFDEHGCVLGKKR
ncbi:DUF4124 domain-containing protein [Pseudomonas stutzeri]|uniref:DUF4124 domain-containing protein n=1 Tax=Stutzerimonas stutzeri TaxID=316 RepID=A0A2N8S2H3_STUST|nr:DUF4124 domain-containing protein [Stutzerimonas stutzeri]MCQ4296382.1 DUF4124 domain-containing protein [Stutzerimonas stutzeri]PNF80818.1 hypothetical protein CXK92_11460 [Stutzerimonas stutzeri]